MVDRFDFVRKYLNDSALDIDLEDNRILVYVEYAYEFYVICNADCTEWYANNTEWVRYVGHRNCDNIDELLVARKYVRRLGYDLCGYECTKHQTYIYKFRNRATKEIITLNAHCFDWAGYVLKNYLDIKENK